MEKKRKPFNVKLFYRRTALIIYDIISIILSSYLAILIRYDGKVDLIPEHFIQPIERFLLLNILLTLFSMSFVYTAACGLLREKRNCRTLSFPV